MSGNGQSWGGKWEGDKLSFILVYSSVLTRTHSEGLVEITRQPLQLGEGQGTSLSPRMLEMGGGASERMVG